MNRNQFISFIGNPDKLSERDGFLLADLVKNFPYFQTAHLLYAKSLHNQNSIHYNNQLKITATYATDRKVLHYLITAKAATEIETVKISQGSDEINRIEAEQIVNIEIRPQNIARAIENTEILDAKSKIIETAIILTDDAEKTKENDAEQSKIIKISETTTLTVINDEQPIIIEKASEISEEIISSKESISEQPLLIDNGLEIKEGIKDSAENNTEHPKIIEKTLETTEELTISNESITEQLIIIENAAENTQEIQGSKGSFTKHPKIIEKTGEISIETAESKETAVGPTIVEKTVELAEIKEGVVEQFAVIEKTAEIIQEPTDQKNINIENNDVLEVFTNSPSDSLTADTANEQPIIIKENNNSDGIINNTDVIIEADSAEDKKEIIAEQKAVLIANIDSQKVEANAVVENSGEIISDELEKEYLEEIAISRTELEISNTDLFPEDKSSEDNKGLCETVESNFVLNIPIGPVTAVNIDTQAASIKETYNQNEFTQIAAEGAAANFDSSQNHSFSEWLKYTSKTEETPSKDIKPDVKPEENASKKAATDLIDNFLREQPKMSKPKTEFYNPVNMAKQSVAEDISFVSETLAKIFVLQGNYIKALQAYENLRLKYPEKRLYFAAQIKNLRKLINQTK